MLQARRINDQIAVSPQIRIEDVAEIAAAGYKSIVCNRHDDEEPSQLKYAEIEAEAKKHGLEMRWQPVVSGGFEDEQVRVFGELAEALPAPLFAYCRSGTRSVVLWALSQAGKRPTADILREAAAAGYDLSGLAPRLEALAS